MKLSSHTRCFQVIHLVQIRAEISQHPMNKLFDECYPANSMHISAEKELG